MNNMNNPSKASSLNRPKKGKNRLGSTINREACQVSFDVVLRGTDSWKYARKAKEQTSLLFRIYWDFD